MLAIRSITPNLSCTDISFNRQCWYRSPTLRLILNCYCVLLALERLLLSLVATAVTKLVYSANKSDDKGRYRSSECCEVGDLDAGRFLLSAASGPHPTRGWHSAL